MTGLVSMTVPQMMRRECTIDGRARKLTRCDADLLTALLIQHPSRSIPLHDLICMLWPDPALEPRCAEEVVSVYLTRLRRMGIEWVCTIGFGYRIPRRARAGAAVVPERLAA